MIIDRIENIPAYSGLGENYRLVAEWLKEKDLALLAPGQIQIQGEKVFANLADNPLSRKEPAYESHRLYADIQVIVNGHELFYLGTEGIAGESSSNSDFYPCSVSTGIPFVLESGWFVIFLPGEMHAPRTPADEVSVCRKLVVKVLC